MINDPSACPSRVISPPLKNKLLLLTDNLTLQEAIKPLLQSYPTLEIAGQTSNTEVINSLLDGMEIDYILVDLDLPSLSFEIFSGLLDYPSAADMIGIASQNTSVNQIFRFVKAGLNACLYKPDLLRDFQQALVYLQAGHTYLAGYCADAFVKVLRSRGQAFLPKVSRHAEYYLALLTPREREMLYLIMRGLDYECIAEICEIALSTVKTHLNSLYLKLGVKNRAQAILKVSKTDLELLLDDSLTNRQKVKLVSTSV
ncbi:MAG: LuxR C-terminal-related transcriptional regulator [Candidatus Caenarcaniphilales bacterium]|nr:LuxR C-terminal-related transcriptional regulator [Candidatus Caenarcaniphilales bacterium]